MNHDEQLIDGVVTVINSMLPPPPNLGSVWKHRNGNTYRVLAVTNEHAEPTNQQQYPVVVVYAGDNGNVWSRLLNDWHRSMTLLLDNPNKLTLSCTLSTKDGKVVATHAATSAERCSVDDGFAVDFRLPNHSME